MKRLGILDKDEDSPTSDDAFLRYVELFRGPLTDPAVKALTALCGLKDATSTEDHRA